MRPAPFRARRWRRLLALPLLAALSGACRVSGCERFCRPDPDAGNPDLVLLAEGEEPRVVMANDILAGVRALQREHHRVLGWSSFNGPYAAEGEVRAQARRVGATIAVFATRRARSAAART